MQITKIRFGPFLATVVLGLAALSANGCNTFTPSGSFAAWLPGSKAAQDAEIHELAADDPFPEASAADAATD